MRVHPNARSAARGGGGFPLRRDRRRSGARGLTRVVRCARARFRKRDVAAIGNTSERAPEAEGEIPTMKKQRRGLGLTLRVDPGKRSPITLTDHKKRIRKRKRSLSHKRSRDAIVTWRRVDISIILPRSTRTAFRASFFMSARATREDAKNDKNAFRHCSSSSSASIVSAAKSPRSRRSDRCDSR
jgi:hypothetical protein